MTKSSNRNGKGGRSASPSSTSSSSNVTKKSQVAMERLMTKNKKNKKNSKEFLIRTVVGTVAFFLVSGLISFLSATNSIQNLANVVPHGAMSMMEPNGSPFAVPHLSPGILNSVSVQDVQVPTPGNSGHIFAQARSTEASNHNEDDSSNNDRENGRNIISLDSNFLVATRSTITANNQYNYYYYDSSSQAFHLQDEYTTFPDKPPATASNFQKDLALSGRYQPTLCKDGQTYGFSDLVTLRNAIHELGDAYQQAVLRWDHYHNAVSEYETIKFLHEQSGEVQIELPPPLPDHLTAVLEMEPDPFVICPFASLRSPLGRHLTININAEDVVIECDSCVIDTPGTHFSFGPYAKNVLIKGITMMGATETSIVFRHDGADASFEDCYWVNNDSIGMNGAVADMNSTSTVKFFRCEISDMKQAPPRVGIHGVSNTVTSSLTLRS